MARPRSENYHERRQTILDGAARLFAEQGFASTSIATIADACGTSKALLYHYYHSKETLLYDMLFLHCELLVKTAKQAIKEDDAPEEQLRLLVRSLMALYMHSHDKHVVLLNDLHCLPNAEQERVRSLQNEVVQVVKDLVAKLRPDLKSKKRTALGMYLMGAINWTYTWFKAEGPMSAQEYADLATALFLNGLHGASSKS